MTKERLTIVDVKENNVKERVEVSTKSVGAAHSGRASFVGVYVGRRYLT